jgi:hypothetical protein
MSEMASLVIEAVYLIIKARQYIAYSAAGNEIDFISLVSLFVDVFLVLGIVWLKQGNNPAQEALFLVLEKVDGLVHLLVNN